LNQAIPGCEAISRWATFSSSKKKGEVACGEVSKQLVKFKWAGDQEAVTFLGYRPIRSWIGSEVILLC